MSSARKVAACRESSATSFARKLGHLNAGTAVAARGSTVQTLDGRSVIDFASGSFGYGHPHVRARLAEQIRELPLSSRMFLSRPLAMLVKRLADLSPGDLEVSYPCNSGTEAVEGALKLARGFHPKRRHFVAMEAAYHGATMGALGVCGIHALRRAFHRLPIETMFVPYGDASIFEKSINEETIGVILEPVATAVGVQIPPLGYLKALRERCHATGTLLIVDEITTGLGRTGRLFAVDHERTVPDILVVGGALGGGMMPVAAYVTRRKINDRVYGKRDPAFHGSTTGGNPAACAAALGALEVLEEEDLVNRARDTGAVLLKALGDVFGRYHEWILDVQGRGLLVGIRVRDIPTAREVQRLAMDHGVLVRVDGCAAGQAWIGLRPALLVTTQELEQGLAGLVRAFDVVSLGLSHG